MSSSNPLNASSIVSESIWNNNLLQIGNKTISPSLFHNKIGAFFVGDLFDHRGDILDWNSFKPTQNISEAHYFNWLQIVDVLPKHWKESIKYDEGNSRICVNFHPIL